MDYIIIYLTGHDFFIDYIRDLNRSATFGAAFNYDKINSREQGISFSKPYWNKDWMPYFIVSSLETRKHSVNFLQRPAIIDIIFFLDTAESNWLEDVTTVYRNAEKRLDGHPIYLLVKGNLQQIQKELENTTNIHYKLYNLQQEFGGREEILNYVSTVMVNATVLQEMKQHDL